MRQAAADRRCPGLGRAQLVEAAGALMAERGSIDVSIHDIARRSGVSSALIKYHFGHKEGLLLSLLETIVGDSIQRLQGLVARDLPAPEKLRLHIQGVLHIHYRHPYLNRLLHHLLSSSEEARRHISLSIVQPMLSAQTAILEQGKADGLFRDVNPMNFYVHVIGASDHLFYGLFAMKYALGVADTGEALRATYGDDLVRTILEGIAARPA